MIGNVTNSANLRQAVLSGGRNAARVGAFAEVVKAQVDMEVGAGNGAPNASRSVTDAGYGTGAKMTAGQPYHNMDFATFKAYRDSALSSGYAPELAELHKLSAAYSTCAAGTTDFEAAFPKYDVTTHVGNADIPDEIWQRNDFPRWKYFDKGASADCLNGWTQTGANPPLSDTAVQKGLNSIGSGKMAILIPDALQKKMDAAPEYAAEIMEKVQKWKTDYDDWDNAAALSLGMNPYEHQASKSYCISLDEDGNVKQFCVTSPGRITVSGDDSNKIARRERERKAAELREALYRKKCK